jgi:prophage maintenance system killer protein
MERGLEIYRVEEGEVVFDIDSEKETIWATQDEIAKLFDVDRTVVGRHLKNIYKDEELSEERTCAKKAQVQSEGGRRVVRQVKRYNLDAIISVGYRVNSKKATKFRVWAPTVLKRYVVDGAAVNERRIKELPGEKLENLEGTLSLVRRLMSKTELEEGEAKGILEVISRYGKTMGAINEFEAGEVSTIFKRSGSLRRTVSIAEVRNLADNLRERLAEREAFGTIKDERSLDVFLGRLENDDTGRTVAEKAARLLYYIVKDEPFEDGNRQIGALIFIYFLTINDCHLAEDGETKVSDRALTAIVLLISESERNEKELMISIIAKLLE